MVDFGSDQGRSDFETAGVAYATLRISKERERRAGPQDAVYGRTLKSGQHDCATYFVAKLVRANGGCLGVKRRRKTWLAAISLGELLNKL